LGVKWLGHEVDHSPPSNAEVKNEWSFTSALPIYLYDVDRDSFTIKEVGLEVSAENTKYMFIFCEQNAGQNHNIQIANKSFENVASSNTWEQHKQIKIVCMKKSEWNKLRERLLPFSPESFVLPV
jgi:hypothetical protein